MWEGFTDTCGLAYHEKGVCVLNKQACSDPNLCTSLTIDSFWPDAWEISLSRVWWGCKLPDLPMELEGSIGSKQVADASAVGGLGSFDGDFSGEWGAIQEPLILLLNKLDRHISHPATRGKIAQMWLRHLKQRWVKPRHFLLASSQMPCCELFRWFNCCYHRRRVWSHIRGFPFLTTRCSDGGTVAKLA